MTRDRSLQLQTVVEARAGLRWFREAIDRGELAAGRGVAARLEGATAALDALATGPPTSPGGGLWSGVRREPDAVIGARDGLRRILEAIRSGELRASPSYVARLEGAIAALDAVLGESGE